MPSSMWNHFDKIDNGYACKLCSATYGPRSSTSTLSYHYENKHNREAPISAAGGSGSGQTQSRLSFKRRRPTHDEQEKFNWAVADWLWLNMRPFSIVEDEGFRNIINVANPELKVLGRDCYHRMVDKRYTQALDVVKTILENASDVSLTADMWTSLAMASYITVTAHWIDEHFEFQHAVLATEEMTERQTGENLAVCIQDITSEFNINSASAVVTDNGANILRAIDLIDDWPQLSCFDHNIHLSVKKGLKTESIKRLLKAVKTIVKHFRKSAKKTNALKQRQRDAGIEEKDLLRLIMSIKTRWYSVCVMLERLVKLKVHVEAVLNDRAQFRTRDAITLKLTESQWTMVNKVISILQPFKHAMVLMSLYSSVTLSLIYPSLFGLSKNCKSIMKLTQDLLLT